ncbi:sporulation protein YqfD [Caldisalinibacter kiritimatiensis]|uniref:Stage IV sporulation protein n=1 Tax=Caldisalinibacter kiritimatiensis TaxID=1304284 RepID=R1CHW8_9FIRM|nr:sporulation protein YqfD [Caldisalinibacter kiritimatiensis]EOD01880.1 Stage IV sporulation protein [Caldisalinibacter kiritimatiensis]
MLVIRIWNYFRGYVIIRIEGLTLERFINLAIAKGIYLWDIVSYDYTTLEAKVGINGFKELRDVVRRVGCRVTIKKKKGFPFTVQKMKYRKMLAFGFVIALGIILFLTSFIWSIEVKGNESIKKEYILSYLDGMDIRPWISKKDINTIAIKKQILYDIDNLSYAHAEIKGTKLIIEIKEKENIKKKVSKGEPCNIVATKDAVIEKVIAKNGKGIVSKGDIVKQGQVLITGVIQDARLEKPLLIHSEGTVLGRTWYVKTFKEPIYKTIKEETGRVHRAREIKLLNNQIQLMNGDIPFDNYIEVEKTTSIIEDSKLNLPIKVIIHEYREVYVRKVKQNIDSLKKAIAVKGVQKIMKELPKNAKVVSKNVEYLIQEDILTAKIKVETIEEIGEKIKVQYIEEE